MFPWPVRRQIAFLFVHRILLCAAERQYLLIVNLYLFRDIIYKFWVGDINQENIFIVIRAAMVIIHMHIWKSEQRNKTSWKNVKEFEDTDIINSPRKIRLGTNKYKSGQRFMKSESVQGKRSKKNYSVVLLV